MAEYIIKQKVTDRMGCCLANAKAEYKAAKDEFTKARFGDYISAIQAMIDVVECSETADVQPVRHGCWITSQPVDAAKEFKCMACGGLIELPVFAKRCYYDYCPNCGARMDKS